MLAGQPGVCESARLAVDGDKVMLRTAEFTVEVDRAPFSLRLLDGQGRIVAATPAGIPALEWAVGRPTWASTGGARGHFRNSTCGGWSAACGKTGWTYDPGHRLLSVRLEGCPACLPFGVSVEPGEAVNVPPAVPELGIDVRPDAGPSQLQVRVFLRAVPCLTATTVKFSLAAPEGWQAAPAASTATAHKPSTGDTLPALPDAWWELRAPGEQTVYASLSGEEQLKLWCNGEIALVSEKNRVVEPLWAPIRLHAGWNQVLVKATRGVQDEWSGRTFGFYFRFE